MNKVIGKIALLSLLVSFSACNASNASSSNEPIGGSSIASKEVSSSIEASSDPRIKTDELYLENGLSIKFKAQGARIDKINFKNKQIAKDGFTVGRCANRIAAGKFTLNGVQYQLTTNNNGNHLHGGGSSWQGPFATKNWTKVEQTFSSITYSIHSADKEEGYPGNFDMTVKYTLSEEGELSIEYKATTDKDTLCNPTNHLFMALNGNTSYSNIKLWIDADSYTPLSSNQLPTGEIKSVTGTQFDYSVEKAFDGSKSYDDNYVLNGEGYRKVATMTGTSLGVKVDVFTDRAGLQLYKDGSGNICLESQMFPDMINHPEFDSYGTTILRAGEEFYSKTSYVFSEVN